MIRKISFTVMAVAAMASVNALAAVSAEEAKELGGAVLTPFGAEKAGNKEGTIPPYTGEIVKAPPGLGKDNPGVYADPWNEKPLFTITAQNAAQYADKLNANIEMFKKFPNYRMDIYPTHRTSVFPKFFLTNTMKNATSCKAVDNELVLKGCYGGTPFPIPKTGAEVMWNHLLEYQGFLNNANYETWIVTADGTPVMQAKAVAKQWYPLFDPNRTTPAEGNDVYWAYVGNDVAPARKVGTKLLVIDAVDSLNVGRRVWQYIPGQRRVKLAPDLAYDTPSPSGGGAILMDDSKGFLGALDRFDWKLIGKHEKFILYNNYKMNDRKACPPNVLLKTKNFPNPDCVRWELHRVWVVEGKLKSQFRHAYKRRIFYWDEDGYFAGSQEAYDGADKLYRIINVPAYAYYDGTGLEGGSSVHQDLQTGLYVTQGLSNDEGLGFYALPPITDKQKLEFTPNSLAGEGVR